MEAITSNNSLLIAGGVTVVVLAVSLDAFSLKSYLAAIAGRLQVKKLSKSSKKEESEKDATLSGIFIYPGEQHTTNMASGCILLGSLLYISP